MVDHYIKLLEEHNRELHRQIEKVRAAHVGCTAATCTTIAALEGK